MSNINASRIKLGGSMKDERETLRLKIPLSLGIAAKERYSDIDLNMTQSVIATLKAGLKTQRFASDDHGGNNESSRSYNND